MTTPNKRLLIILLSLGILTLSAQPAEAGRFGRGGQQDTFYDIVACRDGLSLFIGYAVAGTTIPPSDTTPGQVIPPGGSISSVDHLGSQADDTQILDQHRFLLDGPAMTVVDAETGLDVALASTATVTYPWADRANVSLPPIAAGSRIRLNQVKLDFVNLADYFDAIVQDCSIDRLPPDREAKVFYPAGGNPQNPGVAVPDLSIAPNAVTTSTIDVDFGVGMVIADLNVGMYITGVDSREIEVFLNSPSGTRLRLFGNVASDEFTTLGFGTQEIDTQAADGPDLVRDLMPNFVLDDDSTFGFADSVPPFITEAIKPDDPLRQLNGENPNGTWMLEIHHSGAGEGILETWALDMEVQHPVVDLSRAVTSSTLDGWPEDRLIDGAPEPAWSSNGRAGHLAEAEWASVILAERRTIDRVRIYPRPSRTDPTATLGFPKDFVVQYSYNSDDGFYSCDAANERFQKANNWRPLASYNGYAQPSNDWVTFDFAPVEAQCLRILGVELSQDDYGWRYLQLGEIELSSQGTTVPAVLAVTSSTLDGWPEDRLIDGAPEPAWSSNGRAGHLAEAEWASVILPERRTIDRMRIYPRPSRTDPTATLGFPKDFVIQYSYNSDDGFYSCDAASDRFQKANNWRPLASYNGYAQPSNDWVTFDFAPVEAQCLRILGVELSQDDYGWRYLQLGEIELFGQGTTVPAVLAVTSSTLDGWPEDRLIDGAPEPAWSSNGRAGHLAEAEWASVILPERRTIDRARIYPRPSRTDPTATLGFPKDFVVQYSYNSDDGFYSCDTANERFQKANNWRPLASYNGYAQPSNDWVTFDFAPVEAQCLRILGVELSQDDYGWRYLQLGEIELSNR